MEYHCNKDSSVAIKIFELGIKAFPNEPALAVKYLQFMIQINDENSKQNGQTVRPLLTTRFRRASFVRKAGRYDQGGSGEADLGHLGKV